MREDSVEAWGLQIRTNHRYGYRCGRWADLIDFTEVRGRPCYVVRFPDGDVDQWVINDPDGEYEMRPAVYA